MKLSNHISQLSCTVATSSCSIQPVTNAPYQGFLAVKMTILLSVFGDCKTMEGIGDGGVRFRRNDFADILVRPGSTP